MARATYESTFRRHDYASALAATKRISNVNETARDGGTLLGAAAYYAHVEACMDLLDRGAELEKRDGDGRTALLQAAWALSNGTQMEFRRRTIELLLSRGAEVTAADDTYGKTVLHHVLAAAWGAPELVGLVLEHGADPYARTAYGATPLMIAAAKAHLPSIELLLARGVDVSAKDDVGQDALFCAVSGGVFDHEIAARPAVVARLLSAGAALDGSNRDTGATLLIAAAHSGEATLVEACLAGACEIDAALDVGMTALHAAAAADSVACVRLLLDAGASTDVRDGSKRLPVDCAHSEAVRKLFPPPAPKTRTRAKRGA